MPHTKYLVRLYLVIIAGLLISSSESVGLALRTFDGLDVRWSFADKLQLTYCVSSDAKENDGFGSDYDTIVTAMENAANDWEAAADVDFIHIPAEDSACTNTNENVLFNVAYTDHGIIVASAFFPNATRSNRVLSIDEDAIDSTLVGTLRHELGHILGFVHEHTRPEAEEVCFEDNDWRPLTDYDSSSVMHYLGLPCGGTGDPSRLLTDLDKNGAACLYGAADGFTIDTEICEPPAPVPDQIENVQTGSSSSPYTSVTIPSLVVSGSNPCIAVCFTENDLASVQSVTWNGGAQSFQEVVAAPVDGDSETSLWFLGNATPTTSDVVVNMSSSSSDAALGVAIAISGCAAGAPTLTDTDSCSSCDTATYPLTTTVDNTLLLTCTRTSANSPVWGHGSGQTGLAGFLHTGESLTSSGELKVSAGLETLTDTNAFAAVIRGVAMGIEVAEADPDPARVARWTFDQTLVDAEGNANLTYGGGGSPAYVTGLLSDAIDLDGDNFATAGVHSIAGTSLFADTGNPFSVSLYFKTSAATGVILSSAGGGTVSEWDFTLGLVNGDVSARLRGTATLSSASYNDGEWHHLVVTWDETAGELYIDGELETALGVGESTQDTGQDIIIGSMDGGTVNFFTGTIDDVHIYNYELSAGEISALAEVLDEPEPVAIRRRFGPVIFR
jgi:hypothetical protein